MNKIGSDRYVKAETHLAVAQAMYAALADNPEQYELMEKEREEVERKRAQLARALKR